MIGRRQAENIELHLPELLPDTTEEMLSPAQTTLWFIDRLEGSGGDQRLGGTYNIPVGWHVRGPLVLSALDQALNHVLTRHAILRAAYPESQAGPQVTYLPLDALALRVVDLRNLPESKRDPADLFTREADFCFPIARGPLFRASLMWLGDEDYALILNQHHIIADGWSMGLLYKEFIATYAAVVNRVELVSTPPRFHYRDYAAWQKRLDDAGIFAAQLEWWRHQLAEVPKRLELASDYPRPTLQTYEGATVSLNSPAEPTRQLLRLQQREGLTSFMTLHTLAALLFARYTGQNRICIGSPLAGRTHGALEDMLGMFVTTMAFPHRITEGQTFREALVQTRDLVLDCFAHQNVSFDRVVEAVQPERDLSHTPLFQVMLAVQNLPEQGERIPRLVFTQLEQKTTSVKFELDFAFLDTEEGFSGLMAYNTDIFSPQTAQRMASQFERFACLLSTDPDQLWERAEFLSTAERNLLLHDLNNVAAGRPEAQLIHELMGGWTERTPHATALAFDPMDGTEPQTLTYAEMTGHARTLAATLQANGIRPETPVGICMPPSLERMVAVMAVLEAGGYYVPLDPEYPSDRLNHIVDDAGIQRVLTHAATDNHHWATQVSTSQVQLTADDSNQTLIREVTPANGAYVIYTSGSTGRPKGVLLTHLSLCNLVTQQQRIFEVRPGDRILQLASFSFDVSISEWTNALCSGAVLQLVPRDHLLPTIQVPENLDRWKITHIMPTPAWLAALEAPFHQAPRVIVSGGEACTPQLAERWGRGRRFVNAYGPTENTICTTALVLDSAIARKAKTQQRALPLGQPLGNLTVVIHDRFGQLASPGCAGELCSGGMGVGRAYCGRPALTAEKFVPDPYAKEPGARLYRTGDLVRLSGEDLTLEFLGRIDHQVKLRGLRIELGEIEAVLLEAEGVERALVLIRELEGIGPQLVAYLQCADNTVPAVDPLKVASGKLPAFMVPGSAVYLTHFPTTLAGKLDLNALPLPARTTGNRPKVRLTATEETIAGVWGELLQRPGEDLHPEDAFFSLGGHSLLAVRVVNRLRETFGLELAIRDVFEHATLGGLASLIDGHLGIDTPKERESLDIDPSTADAAALSAQYILDQIASTPDTDSDEEREEFEF